MVARTSITDVLALLGGPGLDDSNDAVRRRYRQFLLQPKWSPQDIGGWINECLELGSRARPEFYFALQDLVVSMGVQFGMEVEFGSYTGAGAQVPFDGRWRTAQGHDILVEVKSSPWPIGTCNQLGSYLDAYASATDQRPNQVFGIYAIGDGDFSPVIDQIKGGEYRNRMKVISFCDLVKLFSLLNLLEQQMPARRIHQVIQDLLLPFESVNVGSILEIIQGLAIASFGEQSLEDSATCGQPQREEWRRSELFDFLDDCQPNQVAMLLALCSSPSFDMSAEQMLERMSALSPVVPGLADEQTFSAKTLGGTRSGFSKREQQLGKNSVIGCRNGHYYIREEYAEWVTEWLTQANLLPLAIELAPELGGLFADAPGARA